ncbi:MAG: methyltransferase [Phycisphaera sp.]|nr:methyltransferase [Phycisphaera sp.]
MFDETVQAVIDEVDALRNQVDDHWQIPADEAALLAQLVRVGRCESICEIGTSYGFSTLHLAAATRPIGGHVHTFDISERKTAAARGYVTRAGLADAVTFHTGKSQELLPTLDIDRPFDFVFIDAWKEESLAYLEAVTPRLADHAVLITDNTDTHRDELSGFIRHLRSMPGAAGCNVSVGNGFELTVWQRP